MAKRAQRHLVHWRVIVHFEVWADSSFILHRGDLLIGSEAPSYRAFSRETGWIERVIRIGRECKVRLRIAASSSACPNYLNYRQLDKTFTLHALTESPETEELLWSGNLIWDIV